MYKKLLTIASLLLASSLSQPNLVKAQSQLEHKNLKREVSDDVAVIRFTGWIDFQSTNLLEHYLTFVASEFKEVLLIINSGGGSNIPADRTINYIKELPIKVTTYATGEVQSNAVPLYCTGDNKLATKNSSFMIHYGNIDNAKISIPQDLIKFKNEAKDIMERMESYVTKCSNYTTEEIRKKLENPQNNYKIELSPNEAKNKGIVNQVKTPNNLLKNSCFVASITSYRRKGKSNYINDEVTNHCTK